MSRLYFAIKEHEKKNVGLVLRLVFQDKYKINCSHIAVNLLNSNRSKVLKIMQTYNTHFRMESKHMHTEHPQVM